MPIESASTRYVKKRKYLTLITTIHHRDRRLKVIIDLLGNMASRTFASSGGLRTLWLYASSLYNKHLRAGVSEIEEQLALEESHLTVSSSMPTSN